MNIKYFTTLLLMVLGLAGNLYMETKLPANGFELLIIFAATIIGFIILYGIVSKQDWTQTLIVTLFAILALNALYLFVATRSYVIIFGITLLASLLGLGMSSLPQKAVKKSTKRKSVKRKKKR